MKSSDPDTPAATYDAICIGAGSAGLAFSQEASELGARVLLIEQAELGGTCVNRGCVPKKILWYAAASAREGAFWYHNEPALGIVDAFGRAQARSSARIKKIHASYRERLSQAGIDRLSDSATVNRPGVVSVGPRQLKAEHIVLATGARPSRLDIPGADLMDVSDDVFAWTQRPSRLIIIGGGYIGCEFAAIFSSMGSAVTLITDGARILEDFDADAVEVVAANLEDSGVQILVNESVQELSADSALVVKLTDGSLRQTDKVLCTVGRMPDLCALAPLSDKPRLADSGAIKVDDRLCSSVPGLYAIGDVADRKPLTPVATRDGEHLARMLFDDLQRAQSLDRVPTSVFVFPPLSHIGLTAIEARAKGMTVDTRDGRSRSLAADIYGESVSEEKDNLYKVCFNAQSGALVGMTLVGEGSAEQIAWVSALLENNADRGSLFGGFGVHPTFAKQALGS